VSGSAPLAVVAISSGNGDPDVDQPLTKPDASRRVVAGPTAGNGRTGLCGAALASVARGALGAKAVGLVPEGPDVLVDLVLVQVVFHRSVSLSLNVTI
jgi:hypothetical protein